MIKRFSPFILLGLFLQPALAQNDTSQHAKTWIFLTDKLDTAGKTTVVEDNYLSKRARWRRELRGTGRVMTQYDAPISPDYLQALEDVGVTVVHQSRWLNAVTARLDSRQTEAVAALPFVRTLRTVALLATPSADDMATLPIARKLPAVCVNTQIDYGNSCEQLEMVNAIPPLERGINGEGVNLGFIDTRFDFNNVFFGHPALQHIRDDDRLTFQDFTETQQQESGSNQISFHGMNVSSVAVGFDPGTLIGPAYKATIFAATTEWAPFERNVEEDNFVAALEWMESEGVDVVNSSLGYTDFDLGQNSYTPEDMDGNTGLTTIASDLAVSMGVVVVSSAGNSGTSPWQIISTPADGDSVIAVGGVDTQGFRVSFSSLGPTADGRIKPDVAAQGDRVWIAFGGGYVQSSGTSFSSPMVSGVVAQMLQVNPQLSPVKVGDILRSTASFAENPNNDLGWGIIDADAAIMEAAILTATEENKADIPQSFSVLPPYPNPFTDKIHFDVQASQAVNNARMDIYNILGQQVDTPFTGTLRPGTHQIVYSNETLPPGLYIYSFKSDHGTSTGKIILAH